ncbi:MAG: 16S rRNA (uracil(1498)-N(3))-methyltransferase [Ruminococcaceae bacterium]|nr:16S rRNA (uracil(1498)-N(3))-methyltransferase [Oscillospiraceae bacterium]
MAHFFVRSTQINGDTVRITGDDAHHISRSLRMAAGEHITVADDVGFLYDCRLFAFLPDAVEATVEAVSPCGSEPPCPLLLFQALPKGDKLDGIIQKSVECGVLSIHPFESERCIVRAKREAEAHKTERRNRIALEAAKQSKRGVMPTVCPTVSFDEMLKEASLADHVLFCYEGEGTEPIGMTLRDVNPKKGERIAVVIGSEGGFSEREAQRAREAGFLMTGLGSRILRTETASAFAFAAISCMLELS